MKWLVPTCPLLRAQTLMEYMDINHRYKNGSSPNISIVRERGGGGGGGRVKCSCAPSK